MMHLMDRISDKPDWERKVRSGLYTKKSIHTESQIFDESIAQKWKEEALATEGVDISEAMIDWCIEELRYKTKTFGETKSISVYDADVVKSDTIIPESLKLALRAATAPLEDVPEDKKDWHPGSNNQVLDLVHPSLFPLVYGRTRILPNGFTNLDDCVRRCGEGEVSTAPALDCPREDKSFSRRFQWLPCDVNISSDGAKITSYINNLHPQEHEDLYRIIEEIISCSIPLWNMSLTPSKAPGYGYHRITYKYCEYDPDPEELPSEEGPQQGEDEDEDEYNERRKEWIRDMRVVVQPEPKAFQPLTVPDRWESEYLQEDGTLKPDMTIDLRRDFCEKGLQVIVKLANIHLTPENPEYPGGSWHVEGQLNEHICATALYYYDSHNITPGHLAFRQQVNPDEAQDVGYQQDHHDWLWEVFGCENEEPGIQHVGAVETREGRLVTFPNILQHKVQPFELADPTKPGHRKILALFLVDPNIKIISTANVPCQRRDWWREYIEANGNALGRLPIELHDLVFDLVDFPLDFDEAASLRLELMEERKRYVADVNEALKENIFSLCEH
ncbi:hypothetical protein BD779DRAFT_257282 [Infundibulicybe gibba]|nr:hypothetical protein BD779DRAFT_257282 [Infundibulicybe gibba]